MSEIKIKLKEETKELYERLLGIVHCKGCKYWLPHTQCGYDADYGEYHNYYKYHMPDDEWYAEYWEADDYCSFGEQKEQEHE